MILEQKTENTNRYRFCAFAFITERDVYVCARTTYNMVCALSAMDFGEKVLFRTLFERRMSV